jgi:acyl-CoA thioesterase-1
MLWILGSGRRLSLLGLALLVAASLSVACNRDPRDPGDTSPPAAVPSGPAATSPAAAAAPASAAPSTSPSASPASSSNAAADAPAGAAAPAAGGSAVAAARPRIVVFGDSLSAGLGLAQSESFPARLQRKVDEAGLRFEIVNAGLSGDTSAGGIRRLDWSLDGDVRVLILELGANDGLRGLSVAEMTANLSAIIERAQARNISVLLCGMEAPPNFGASYTREFHAAFPALARKYRLPFVPFLLNGVAGTTDLNQADGIHPNVEGARRVADTVWITLEPLLAAGARVTS